MDNMYLIVGGSALAAVGFFCWGYVRGANAGVAHALQTVQVEMEEIRHRVSGTSWAEFVEAYRVIESRREAAKRGEAKK